MKSPDNWVNYEEVFGVKTEQRFYDYDVTCIHSTEETNVLWPGQEVKYTFQLVNNTDEDISEDATVEIIQYGTRGIPDNIWLPEVHKKADVETIPVEVDISANGYVNIEIEPSIPETLGAYAIVFDLGKHGRRMATSLVRTFKPDKKEVQYPKQALDKLGPEYLSRIGVKAVRYGVPYIPTNHVNYVSEMEKLDRKLREYKRHDITVLLMFMGGPNLQPLGTPRSHLDENDVFLKTKQDYVWLPGLDDDFKKFVKNICIKHGWPDGCVTGVHLWNEPWEGMSISGWQSDMVRYRNIYKAMAEGVLEAREEGADVLVGGCDSKSNAWDKLFADGSNEFLPIFDFVSIHYQGMESPCLYPEWNNREHYKGRVKIWDTESWVGNTDDRLATVVATNRSAGYDRSMGIYKRYMKTEPKGSTQKIRTEEGEQEISSVPFVWSATSAMGAVQNMIGERDFNELLFKKGLPWIMLFDGYNNNPDDGTAVVVGDIGEAFGAEKVLFRNVRGKDRAIEKKNIREQMKEVSPGSARYEELEKKLSEYKALVGGKMTIENHESYSLYDFHGNQMQSSSDKIEIPLSFQGYFLRTDGSEGSFSRLKNALEKGRVEGYEPVQIIAKDMTRRIKEKPVLELEVTNILNRPVEGTLNAKLGELEIEFSEDIAIGPHETRVVPIQVVGGGATPDNTYPLDVTLDCGEDGIGFHYEEMHVNVISRLTPEIDGKLEEWGDCLPQKVSSQEASISTTEAAWHPYEDYDTNAQGMASGYLAYDEDYFYFGAKVADETPHPGTLRFETRDDDQFFYPDTAYRPDFNRSFKKEEEIYEVSADDRAALQNPDGSGRVLNFWKPDDNNIGFGMELNLPDDKTTKVAFYLPDIRKSRGTEIEVRDAENMSLLETHDITKLWGGAYLVFEASGDVVFTFKGGWHYDVKVAGVWFDKTSKNSFGKTSARYIKEDFDTKGNWKGVYGKDGFWIFGIDPQLPRDISASDYDNNELLTLIWPEGVRNYTYRKYPILPCNSDHKALGTDNVQIAFNVIPIGEDGYGSHPKGTMPRYIGYKCTDYEYALNEVDPKYGGGTEIWRLLVPGMVEKHFYPRQPESPYDGPVKDGKLAVSHEGNTRITECAIPWSEIPQVREALDKNQEIKFSFRVNDNGNSAAVMELARDRSVSKKNSRAFHASWKTHWANEVSFRFEED